MSAIDYRRISEEVATTYIPSSSSRITFTHTRAPRVVKPTPTLDALMNRSVMRKMEADMTRPETTMYIPRLRNATDRGGFAVCDVGNIVRMYMIEGKLVPGELVEAFPAEVGAAYARGR
jgi:hypothetical protein